MSRNIGAIPKIPELNRRLLFAALMLVVYRLGVFVPTPGIDPEELIKLFEQTKGTIFDILNLFSGGALERASIFALGVMPYITSSIIMSLLVKAFPTLEAMQKEGEAGRRKINQYSRYGTVLICIIQGLMLAITLEGGLGSGASVVRDPGWMFRFTTVMTLTAGTLFLMWIGEQISERGIGNGISLIIAASILTRMPAALWDSVRLIETGELTVFGMLLSFVNIPYLRDITDVFLGQGFIYNSMYAGLIIFFAYFYTAVIYNPDDLADNLRKNGGFIPGIRPGKKTADYIEKILGRITFIGAIYVAAVCVLPSILQGAPFNIPFFFGGTSLLIVVGVTLDTVQQIESFLITHSYEGFIRKRGMKGPRRYGV